MDFLKPTAEHIALYVQFWVKFLLPPAGALKEIEGSGTIQPQLIIFLGIGVLVSWTVGYAGGMLGLPDDPSAAFQAAKEMGYDDIPRVGLTATLVTLVFSAVFHGLVRIWTSLLQLLKRKSGAKPEHPEHAPFGAYLGGNVFDTINGAMGFVAFFAPLGVLIMVLALLAAQYVEPIYALLPTAVFTAVFILVYLPASLAAAHSKTSYYHVFVSLGGVIVTFMVLFDFLA